MDKQNKLRFGIGLVPAMILPALLLSRIAYGQEVIMTSPIHGAKQGHILILYPSEDACFKDGQPQTLRSFGNGYRCDPDGRLVIGIDFQQEPGTYRLEGTDIYIDVLDANYDRPYRRRRRPRRIPEKKRIELEAKRADERLRIARGLASGPSKYPNWPTPQTFRQPLDTERIVTDPFGITRMYWWDRPENARPSPHRGEDRRAQIGTPAYAVGYCAVTLADRYMREGNMVALYCGSGIYFLYMHLRDIAVQQGQIVEKGQLIGHTGDTGVPGQPHLHFQAKILGAAVDPQAFIEEFNESLKARGSNAEENR